MPVKLLSTRRFADERGWFTETYNEARWTALGVDCRFVQDNRSLSRAVGTIRGIHFQTPPHAQAKLVHCAAGAIVDYAVDLRRGSPTYGRHVSATLSADNGLQLFVPIGFGHGFVTLEPDSEVVYKTSDLYAPDHDGGLRWDCPDIAIAWPLPATGAILSDRDRGLPGLAAFESPFAYDGDPLQSL
jgi:dTDP-4-dehydrorhamnose 3,5-epimerase